MRKLKFLEKRIKKIVILKFLLKKPKELSNKQLSDILPFPPERKKRAKRLTKYQILRNELPLFDAVGVLRKQYAFRNYARTYEVEVMDSISLGDSLFLAKKSIIDFFRDLLEEKRGCKYVLSARVTFKKWNNATNTYDIDTIYRNSDLIKVINRSLI